MDIADITHCAVIRPIVFAIILTGCGHIPTLIIPRDPLSAEEHTRLGGTYEAQGLHKEAVAQYALALDKDPAYLPALMSSGNAAFMAGDLKSAERAFGRALKISPGHAGAENNLAMVYLTQNKDLDMAEHLAQKAAAQDDPLKPYFLDTLANVYLRQKRYDEAKVALDQAQAATAPDNAAVGKQLVETRALLNAAQH